MTHEDLIDAIAGIGTGTDDRESLRLVLQAIALGLCHDDEGSSATLELAAQAALWRMQQQRRPVESPAGLL